MPITQRLYWSLRQLFAAALLIGLLASAAQAHLMPAQRGTINFVNNGAFFIISVPVSALTGIDDNQDQQLSSAELKNHLAAIKQQVTQGYQLIGPTGPWSVQGLLLNLAKDPDKPTVPAAHIIAMGRFAIDSSVPQPRLKTSLFGATSSAQKFWVKVTRGPETHLLSLSPAHPDAELFPSSWQVFSKYTTLGVEHVLTGLDHLLFLLIVLFTSLRKRLIVAALTCFTIGHAITLAATLYGGISVSPQWVEPAIAASIVGLALYDWSNKQRGREIATSWWLAMVFACALIHGLGLASSLAELGLNATYQFQSLAGFNLGIELGQIMAAAAVILILAGIGRVFGDAGVLISMRAGSIAAMVLGTAWFAQRVLA